MKVTLNDIARELGISTAAVSKALNDLPGVSDRLRLEVKQTAERMGYRKHLKSAGGFAEHDMRFIVVLHGTISGEMLGHIEGGISHRLRSKGYYELRYMIDTPTELRTETTKELFLDKISRGRGVVGVLACFIKLSDILIAKLYDQHIAVVMLENKTDFGRCVTIDNIKGSYKATTKLIELGRKRIGVVMPSEEGDHIWYDRIAGYKRALKEKGLPYDPKLMVCENWVAVKPGGLATRVLLDQSPDVDAILFGSDRQAQGGMKMLRDLGRRIPEDVAVIGFDDEEVDPVLQPSLSSVRQPVRKMAETGLGLLLDSIEKGDLSHRAVELDTELILRGSCLQDYKEPVWL